ncbi:hypothetical protein [Streptomyces sp. SBT349]|uniref:hypothetical protein n=1 Tax=Streptomyces sp. SBT349 TaxID=1580539 RepID=UPI00131D7F6E|nr:hypothetical protein [Streptomyces sp. SBT349]
MAALALALVMGCSDGSDISESSADDIGMPESASPPPSGEDGAVAAYLAMWEDAAAASWTSDVDHPRLDDHATDDALALLKFVTEGHAADGHVAKGAPKHDVEIVESSAEHRELRDCMDSSDWLMYDSSGQLVDDVPGSHRWVDAMVQLRSDGWLVADLVLHERATC